MVTNKRLSALYVNTAEEIAGISDIWEEVYCSDTRATPFQSFNWVNNWWKYFGSGKLKIILLYDGDKPVAIAPLYLTEEKGRRVLKFIGTGNTDYLCFLTLPDYELSASEYIHNLITNDNSWDEVYLEGIPEKRHAVFSNQNAEIRRIINPGLRIGNGFPEYLAGLSNSFVKGIESSIRRLNREGTVKLILPSSERTVDALNNLFSLHQKSRNEKNSSGIFTSEKVRKFIIETVSELKRKNRAQIFEIAFNNFRAASLLVFISHNTFYYYIGGYDPALKKYSPGSVLLYNVIKYCFEHRIEIFDFMRGGESYKYKWGAVDFRSEVVLVCRNFLS